MEFKFTGLKAEFFSNPFNHILVIQQVTQLGFSGLIDADIKEDEKSPKKDMSSNKSPLAIFYEETLCSSFQLITKFKS